MVVVVMMMVMVAPVVLLLSFVVVDGGATVVVMMVVICVMIIIQDFCKPFMSGGGRGEECQTTGKTWNEQILILRMNNWQLQQGLLQI